MLLLISEQFTEFAIEEFYIVALNLHNLNSFSIPVRLLDQDAISIGIRVTVNSC